MAGKTVAGKKFRNVYNLTGVMQIVTPDEADRRGGSITVLPYDAVSLKAADFVAWAEDRNLARAVELGFVEVSESDERARSMPPMPSTAPSDPTDRVLLEQLVRGNDEEAQSILGAKLDKNSLAMDRTYMRDIFPELLRTALAWLRAWGPPEPLKWRIGAIQARQENDRLARAAEVQ